MSHCLHRLLAVSHVGSVPVALGPRDEVHRLLYWTKDFEQWCLRIETLGVARSYVSLPEQLNQAFADFISGRPLTGLTRCDPPKGQGIWRLKTPDLRLYGWADEPQCFILAAGEFKSVLAQPGPPKDKDLGKVVVSVRRKFSVTEWVIGDQPRIFPATRQQP